MSAFQEQRYETYGRLTAEEAEELRVFVDHVGEREAVRHFHLSINSIDRGIARRPQQNATLLAFRMGLQSRR